MYLAELRVNGFRRVDDLTLRFKRGLNILVGPNNVGKTAIVDGLRALLTTADEGALRVDDLDLHQPSSGSRASSITFNYVFRDLSLEEEADFYPALKPLAAVAGKPTQYEAHFTVRYAAYGSSGRLRPKRWCGDHEENAISVDMLDELRAVYLPPLRDPASGLRPSRSSQLARLMDRLANDTDKAKLVALLKAFESALAKEPPVASTQSAVVNRHEAMLGSELKQLLEIGLTPPEFQRIAARLELAVEKFDVEQNGLGYNNLIYMAVVLSEMALNPDAAYKALIVEEPEAHLHPQLQAILLEHLEAMEKPALGEKAVQVFVTSHSQNFASIADLDAIACIHTRDGKVSAFFPREATFGPTKREKLQRYLDITRAELFFARRIMLVEGTAERFLVCAFAAKLGINLRKYSLSVLSTEGLNFDCFCPLFGPSALPIRVAILSDSDPSGACSFPKLTDAVKKSSAACAVEALKNPFVSPFFAQKTLEYDLALHKENHLVMLAALAELHPLIASDVTAAVNAASSDDIPKLLFQSMFDRAPAKNVSKGAYSQTLAQLLSDEKTTFVVPPYINKAFQYLIAP